MQIKSELNGSPAKARPEDPVPEILSSLEPDQLVAAKARSFPRRDLTAPETLLLFSLRLYLLFMIAVVIYQVWMNVYKVF